MTAYRRPIPYKLGLPLDSNAMWELMCQSWDAKRSVKFQQWVRLRNLTSAGAAKIPEHSLSYDISTWIFVRRNLICCLIMLKRSRFLNWLVIPPVAKLLYVIDPLLKVQNSLCTYVLRIYACISLVSNKCYFCSLRVCVAAQYVYYVFLLSKNNAALRLYTK